MPLWAISLLLVMTLGSRLELQKSPTIRDAPVISARGWSFSVRGLGRGTGGVWQEISMLESLGPGIWTVSTPLRLAGAEFGTRMTVVKLSGGGLVLLAPCPIDDALESELRRLGTVRALIAPNAFHHFHFLEASRRFPEAACFLAEGVAEKLRELPSGTKTLAEDSDPLWRDDIDQCRIGGAPRVNEVAFFHRASKTLILTDLCFHFDPAPAGWTGILLRLAGAHGRLAVSRLMRSMLKDRAAVRTSIERIASWNFEKIVVTHGEVVRSDGYPLFLEATADL